MKIEKAVLSGEIRWKKVKSLYDGTGNGLTFEMNAKPLEAKREKAGPSGT